MTVQAEARLAAGDASGALADARAAEQMTREAESGYEWIQSLIAVARARIRLGDDDAALTAAAQAAGQAEASGYLMLLGQAETVWAEVEWRSGRIEDARRLARTALDRHRRSGHRPGEATTLALLEALG